MPPSLLPADPAHGRRLPTGAAVARLLLQLWKRQLVNAASQIRTGRDIRLDSWNKPMAEAVLPLLAKDAQRSAADTLKRLSRALASQRRTRDLHRLLSRRSDCYRALVRKDLASDMVGVGFDVFNERILDALREAVFHFIGEVNTTTSERLRKVLAEGLENGWTVTEITKEVKKIFHDPVRAFAVAVTESSRAVHAGQLLAAKDSGVVQGFAWLASSDACDKCLAIANKEVAIGDAFFVDPKGGSYARVEHPPLHPHCMCSMTEVLLATSGRKSVLWHADKRFWEPPPLLLAA